MSVIITRAIRTCRAYPSQWDAWTSEGQYLYLRYRSGLGTAHAFNDPDPDTWPDLGDWAEHEIAGFTTNDLGGEITIEEFCDLAGLGYIHGREAE